MDSGKLRNAKASLSNAIDASVALEWFEKCNDGDPAVQLGFRRGGSCGGAKEATQYMLGAISDLMPSILERAKAMAATDVDCAIIALRGITSKPRED